MVSQFLHSLFTLYLLFYIFTVANSDLAADKTALLRLRDAVRGRTLWWNQSDPSPCYWSGVTCDSVVSRVTELRLPVRGLSGKIPLNTIGNLTHLRVLSLRLNSLSGSIPSDLGNCTELQKLFLQGNRFSGEIPATLFVLNNLVVINLAGNSFSGKISPGFNNLAKLKILYLENNNLTGSIPELNIFSRLKKFNVSYNQLNGSIPSILNKFSNDSFLGNNLCGQPLSACSWSSGKKLSTGAIAGISIGSVVGLILILVVMLILWRTFSGRKVVTAATPAATPPEFEFRAPRSISAKENSVLGNLDSVANTTGERGGGVSNVVHNGGSDDGMVFFGEGVVAEFGLDGLLRASAEVLGKGTFGTTYKAYLEGEIEVIVKRLKNVCVAEREFREKVEGLGVLVHENLMPLKGYYYGKEEKLLIYDWMPMGSLSALLHGNSGTDRAALTWEIRSKIAFGSALGIEYLHSLGTNSSHGNIRSSNILLTDSYGACVSEYGISQLISTTSTLNLNGYCAPEVTDTRKISQKADVYSFGVLLLELLTGKAPIHALNWNEEGIDLPTWVGSAVRQNRIIDVFDPELLRYQNQEEQMVQLLRIGINCTSQHPDNRPSMVDVILQIKEIYGSRRS